MGTAQTVKENVVETSTLQVVSSVPETDAPLNQEPSPKLGKARSALLEITADPCSSPWLQQMEDAVRKWPALYTYREQPIGDIKKLIEWHHSAQTSGTKSENVLIEGIVSCKTAAAFWRKAGDYIDSVVILESLEKATNEFNELYNNTRAKPLLAIDNIAPTDNHMAVYIKTRMNPMETALKLSLIHI